MKIVFDQLAIDLIEYLRFTFSTDIFGSVKELEEFKFNVMNTLHQVKDILHLSICTNIS